MPADVRDDPKRAAIRILSIAIEGAAARGSFEDAMASFGARIGVTREHIEALARMTPGEMVAWLHADSKNKITRDGWTIERKRTHFVVKYLSTSSNDPALDRPFRVEIDLGNKRLWVGHVSPRSALLWDVPPGAASPIYTDRCCVRVIDGERVIVELEPAEAAKTEKRGP